MSLFNRCEGTRKRKSGLSTTSWMTLLTSAECREIAERKMVEAEGDPVHGKEFRATAHAWLVLAEMIEQAEAIEALKANGK